MIAWEIASYETCTVKSYSEVIEFEVKDIESQITMFYWNICTAQDTVVASRHKLFR